MCSPKMQDEGKTSKAPLRESFGRWKNLRLVLLALFGLGAFEGQYRFTATGHLIARWKP